MPTWSAIALAVILLSPKRKKNKLNSFTFDENIIATIKMRNNFFYPLKW